MLRFGALDALLRQKVDDQDSANPLFPEANRFRAMNKAARKVAAIVDRADETYRVVSRSYTSTRNQGDYPLPDHCERVKQVVYLDEDGAEIGPPCRFIPWHHRWKVDSSSVLEIRPATGVRGRFYTLRGQYLVLFPLPTSTSSYIDVKVWFLPKIEPGTDAESDVDLPDFCQNLLVALAAVELLGPTGDETEKHEQDAAFEREVVEERVTPRVDDGPIRISDDRGDNSFATGF